MTREMLYDAITEIKDELILEAMETKPAGKRVRWLKFGSIAAAVVLAAGLGAGMLGGRLLQGSSVGGSGHNEDSAAFMYYAGPVFPLTTVEGGEGLTAGREVTLDFQEWANGGWPYTNLPVTDSYTLTNATGEDKTVTLLYPFAASLRELSACRPTLKLDGAELETGLLAGQYSRLGGGWANGLPSLSQPESWMEYQALLSDGRYQTGALEDWPDFSGIPVTVYEITGAWTAQDAGGTNPTVHAAFDLDYGKTTVLTYGFHGGWYDRENGAMRVSFTAPRCSENGSSDEAAFYEKERAKPHYVIVVGAPVANFRLIGTHDGAPESTDYMQWGEEIDADARQYETNLESALCTAAERMYGEMSREDLQGVVNRPDFALYFGLLKDSLLDTGVLLENVEERYDLHWLEDLHFSAIQRVFYLKAEVTIPAGGSVTVEAKMLKAGSHDFYCGSSENMGVYGYDLVTRLGSNLDFTTQTAKAVNTERVEIVRQNFGFDWAEGVDTVNLDPAVERYYLEVRRMEKE